MLQPTWLPHRRSPVYRCPIETPHRATPSQEPSIRPWTCLPLRRPRRRM